MPQPLGISIGDPNGIGLEVSLKAYAHALTHHPQTVESLLFIGDPDLIQRTANTFALPTPKVLESTVRYPRAQAGQHFAEAGHASATWVKEGIDACLSNKISGLITAPINKKSWELAGVDYPGHTELLADRCNSTRFGMLLAGKGLRVMLATRHVPLAKVPESLTETEIKTAVDLLYEALPLFGIPQPRIAVCGLNPHAGDGGAIGSEEVDWIGPLLQNMRRAGVPVSGPHPADTIFHQSLQGEYDAIVALYHDQGLAPLKLWAFEEGVNITLGLPIIRTSPDHGTAFAIAGKGIANPRSMIEAMLVASQLAQQENPWNSSFPA